jgi:hypothetical protein
MALRLVSTFGMRAASSPTKRGGWRAARTCPDVEQRSRLSSSRNAEEIVGPSRMKRHDGE